MVANQAVETSVTSVYMRGVIMSDFAAITRQQRATIDALQEKIDSLRSELALLKLEILLKDKRIKELESKLHGTRQHVTEVNQDG